jgi:hypothetical protein
MSSVEVKKQIREIMIEELRMDYDKNRILKKDQEEVIFLNKENIDKAVDEMYKNVDLLELYDEPKKRTDETSSDPEINLYRDYLYHYLDEDLEM